MITIYQMTMQKQVVKRSNRSYRELPEPAACLSFMGFYTEYQLIVELSGLQPYCSGSLSLLSLCGFQSPKMIMFPSNCLMWK